MVWRPYSQAPVAPQAEKLIFFASRRVFLPKPKRLWKTAPRLAKALKWRLYRCPTVTSSCAVRGPWRVFPTLSWHLLPAGMSGGLGRAGRERQAGRFARWRLIRLALHRGDSTLTCRPGIGSGALITRDEFAICAAVLYFSRGRTRRQVARPRGVEPLFSE